LSFYKGWIDGKKAYYEAVDEIMGICNDYPDLVEEAKNIKKYKTSYFEI